MGNFKAEELATLPSFINYCYGTNAKDVAYWDNFLRENPSNAPLIGEARELVQLGGWMIRAEREKAAAMQKLDTYLSGTPPTGTLRRFFPYIAAAASVAAIVAATVFLFRPGQNTTPATAPVAATSETLRKGLTLPDSSFILLEQGASVAMEPGFGGNKRSVRLRGVAYFKVAKDERRPFSVLAGPYIITALGTSFRVSHQADSLQVMLEEGKVKVEQETAEGRQLIAVMAPSDRLDLRISANTPPERTTFRRSDLQAWKAQEIIFDHTPLDEAVRQLEACYDIRIELKGFDPKKETFSGRFRNDRLTEVLEVLCFTLNKRYEITEDTTSIIIH
ncbi:FecR domain-containing protein [Chitinophaga pollutisoli]|uniref:FecR domain-containing protein n=1 Tax=Chitinophaga pollutisoli TaxID=3133966 RepID=A0ABZ2YM86_9BACT